MYKSLLLIEQVWQTHKTIATKLALKANHLPGLIQIPEARKAIWLFQDNDDGSFEFNTIHPQGYPHSDLPQHIHFEVFSNDDNALLITELLFDDDKRLTVSMQDRLVKGGAFIAAMSSGQALSLYNYEIKTN